MLLFYHRFHFVRRKSIGSKLPGGVDLVFALPIPEIFFLRFVTIPFTFDLSVVDHVHIFYSVRWDVLPNSAYEHTTDDLTETNLPVYRCLDAHNRTGVVALKASALEKVKNC